VNIGSFVTFHAVYGDPKMPRAGLHTGP